MTEKQQFLMKTLNKMGIELNGYNGDAALYELGLESLMRKELATKIQRKFGIDLGDQIEQLETLDDLVDHIEAAKTAA